MFSHLQSQFFSRKTTKVPTNGVSSHSFKTSEPADFAKLRSVGFVPPQLQSVRSLVDFEHQAVSMLPCFHQQEIRVLRIFGHARPNLKHVQKFSTTVATSNPTIGASADCFSWRCGPEGGSEPHPKSIQSDQITEAVNWAFTEVFFLPKGNMFTETQHKNA